MSGLVILVALFVAWYVYAEIQAKRENEAWLAELAEDRRRGKLTDEQRAAEGLPSAFDDVTISVVRYCARYRIPVPSGPLPRER